MNLLIRLEISEVLLIPNAAKKRNFTSDRSLDLDTKNHMLQLKLALSRVSFK